MEILKVTRRNALLAAVGCPALLLLPGCRASLPVLSATETPSEAVDLLMQSAEAHGFSALSGMHDVNVAYSGRWHGLIGKLQPSLVDAGFRGGSEERILLPDNLMGQAHVGPRGRKQVFRHAYPKRQGDVRVWFNGEEALDTDRRAAAALVADGYSLFLLGPMLLAKYLQAGRQFVMQVTGIEQLFDGKRQYTCDVLRIEMQPGIGLSDADQLALYIDRESRLMRRVRFSLEGLESTRGALVEVDTWDSVSLHGVQWPTRFHEKLLRPAPLPVHDWHLTGLDVDRGLDSATVGGREFSGAALAPAIPLRSG